MSELPGIVVFDLDDTLYLERDYVRSGFDAVGAFMEARHGVTGFSAVAWRLFESGVRGTTINLALEELGHPLGVDAIMEAVRVYREHRPSISLAPDADTALRAACAAGWTALISDGWPASQRAKAEALGLPGRLDLLLFSDTLGVECRKPSPVPFRRVMEHFDAGASDCVYIGDNPIKDFIGARRLGWKTVRVRRPLGEHARAEPEPGYEADEEYADLSFIARHE